MRCEGGKSSQGGIQKKWTIRVAGACRTVANALTFVGGGPVFLTAVLRLVPFTRYADRCAEFAAVSRELQS